MSKYARGSLEKCGKPLPSPIPIRTPTMTRVDFVYDDGGRAAAGYKGDTGDCVIRAIAIATGESYADVYAAINALAKSERTGKSKRGVSSARNGVYRVTYDKYLIAAGWTWTPTMKIGQGCKVHLRREELPGGRLIVSLSKHLAAVIDGALHDTHDCSRDGARCVYGYWSKKAAQ